MAKNERRITKKFIVEFLRQPGTYCGGFGYTFMGWERREPDYGDEDDVLAAREERERPSYKIDHTKAFADLLKEGVIVRDHEKERASYYNRDPYNDGYESHYKLADSAK